MKKIYAFIVACFAFTASQAQVYSFTSYNTDSETTVSKRYMGEANIGWTFGSGFKADGDKYDLNTNSVFFETIHGARINKYAFAGLGVGFHYYYGFVEEEMYENKYGEYIGHWCGANNAPMAVPIFVNLKGFYPVNDKLKAYVSSNLGYAWAQAAYESGYYDYDYKGGFYGTFEAGIQWKKLNVGFGFTHQTLKPDFDVDDDYNGKIKINNFSLKIGLCW